MVQDDEESANESTEGLLSMCKPYVVHEEDEQYMMVPYPRPEGMRVLEDGYCAPNRPSLTDSKIRSRSFAWIDQYKLVPDTSPKYRPWLPRKPKELHLAHQLWDAQQGWLWLGFQSKPQVAPRLGVCLTVSDVKSVDPTNLCWRGAVHLKLKISVGTTIGLPAGATADAIQRAWPRKALGDFSSEDSAGDFLEKAYGVQCYNLVTDNTDYPPIISGAKSFGDLENTGETIEGSWRFEGVFYCNVQMKTFPFDVCSWDVLLSIIGWSPGLVYSWSALCNLQEFNLYGLQGINKASDDIWNPYTCESNVVPNMARYEESFVYARFHTRRCYQSVMSNIVAPTAIVVALSALAVANASERIANTVVGDSMDTLGVLSTALLTVVAMKFSFSDNIPKRAGSNTVLDIYILTCISLLALAMILVSFFDAAFLREAYATMLFVLLVLVIHLIFAILACFVYTIPYGARNAVIYDKPQPGQDDAKIMEEELVAAGFVKLADLRQ